MDLYTVQWAVPSNQTTNKTNQTNKQNTQNNNKTKTTKHREVGSLPAQSANKKRWHLVCHLEYGHRKWSKTKTTKDTKGGQSRGWQKQQSSMRKTGDPPSQDPRDHREQPFRHNVHPGTSKQTTTTPCRNESGEKLAKCETEGETWSNVRKTAVATAFRAHSESAQ